MRAHDVKPAVAYFDGKRPVRARFAFRAQRRVDVVVKVVHAGSGRPVRRWVKHGLAPGKVHELRWDGRRGDRGVPGDGTYELRAGPAGHRGARLGRFEFHDHVFPVVGPHSYGDVVRRPAERRARARGPGPALGVRDAADRRPRGPRAGDRLQRRALRLLRAHRRPRDAARLLLRPHGGADPALRGRAGAHRRSGSDAWARPATPAASSANCTSSCGRTATTTGRPTDPAPALRAWDSFS